MDLTRRKGHKHFSTPNCPVDVTLAGGDTADSETDCDDRENRQDCDLTLESKSDTSSPRKSFQPLLVVVMAAALMLGAAVLFSLIVEALFGNAAPLTPDAAEIRRLREVFPKEDVRLWTVVLGALNSQHRRKWYFFQPEETKPPTVLLFTPVSMENRDNFTSFIKEFQSLIASILNYKSCITIKPYSHVPKTSSEALKAYLHSRLIEAYASGSRCFHVVGIDRLTGEAAYVLHGQTDSNSSPLRNSFIILSIAEPPPEWTSHNSREIETKLRQHLASLWEDSLGIDEVPALLTRLLPRVGVFFG